MTGQPGTRTLSLEPVRWFSWDFRVLEGDREVARIDRRWLRERASFAIGGAQYEVRRTSAIRGTFALEHEGRPLARATKPSLFRRAFDVRVGAEPYRLEAPALARREFRVLRAGMPVGAIRPVSIFRRSAIAELPAALPAPVQLFLVFLVLVLWKRAADAAATG